MSSSRPESRPDRSSSRTCPTDRDLDRLVSAVRRAARGRDLHERVVEWYEDWIFLFLAWCLKAPPYRVDRDRIGEFWVALTEHPGVPRWKVCQAMDAMGVLFGALGGPEALDLPAGPPPGAPDEPEEAAPSRYLPAGALPETVDARALVPTQADRPEQAEEAPTEERPPRTGGQDPPKTLFNPTGSPLSSGGASAADDGGATPAEWEQSGFGEAPGDKVALNIPGPAAERLDEVSDELDLPASFLLVRAIDLLRQRTGVADGSETDTSALLRQNEDQVDPLDPPDSESAMSAGVGTGEDAPDEEDGPCDSRASAGECRTGGRPSLRGRRA